MAVAALFVLTMVVFVGSRQGGIVEVQDTEAAVIMNYVTGSREVVVTPGYQIVIPFVARAFIFDKSPQEFVMSGDRDIDANHVARLTVRANDGSNFWFDEIKIQYELIPASADFVLADSGSGEAFKVNWVRAYARSILRDEFGRLSAVDVADPTKFRSAQREAEVRLNETLEPHGVHIIQITTPRPKFEDRYEKAIEDRKVADQEVEKLKTRAEQLVRERERRLAEIESDRGVKFEALKGELVAQEKAAEKERVRIEKGADAYKIQQVAEGEAVRSAALEEARGLVAKAEKEAEGLRAITSALEQGGEILVRERLAALLRKVEFQLVPYSRDPQPTRVELLEDGGAVPRAATAKGGSP